MRCNVIVKLVNGETMEFISTKYVVEGNVVYFYNACGLAFCFSLFSIIYWKFK